MTIGKFGRIARTAAVVAASSLALVACSSGSGTAGGSTAGSLASTVDLSDVTISVGSKEAPEQKVLGQVLVQTLKAAGAQVTDNTGLAGTSVVRAALESGEVDTYYEYTGTAWLTIFKQTELIPDPVELFETVRTIDAKNDISWFAAAPLNDTYGVGASKAAEHFGVKTLSEYAEFTRTNPSDATLCAGAEFRTRDDGLPGLEKKYKFTQSDASTIPVEETVIYQAIEQEKCNFLYLTSTDPRILKNEVTVLEDDKTFFPIYNPAVNMTTEMYDANKAEYDKLFEPISKLLTQEAIIELNSKVALDGLPADKVVIEFLQEHKII